MLVAVLTVTLHAPFAHTLKQKRAVIKNLLPKLRQKFNVSAAETGMQDLHQLIVFKIAYLASNRSQADSILDHILNFIGMNTEAEIINMDLTVH